MSLLVFSFQKKKKAQEKIENYKSEFIQAGKNEVNKGLGW